MRKDKEVTWRHLNRGDKLTGYREGGCSTMLEESKDFFQQHTGKELFVKRNGKPYTTRGIAEQLQRWAVRYGIPKEVMHPHSFRHLYAKEFLKRNQNISLLADLMGHSSTSTTAVYLKLSMEEQMSEIDKAMRW